MARESIWLGMPALEVDGREATKVSILLEVVQPWPIPHHPPQGVYAPATRNEPGQGSADSGAAACSLSTACHKQTGSMKGGRDLPRAHSCCGRQLGDCKRLLWGPLGSKLSFPVMAALSQSEAGYQSRVQELCFS